MLGLFWNNIKEIEWFNVFLNESLESITLDVDDNEITEIEGIEFEFLQWASKYGSYLRFFMERNNFNESERKEIASFESKMCEKLRDCDIRYID